VVASDVGGYAIGVLAGRHPMAPSISPKKSWEGFGGSLVAGMITGALTLTLMLGGLVVGRAHSPVRCSWSAATLGDLVESPVKRGSRHQGTWGRLLPRPRRPHGPARLDAAHGVVSYFVLGLLVPMQVRSIREARA
jgi:phosphatidate cytidylyltransferase